MTDSRRNHYELPLLRQTHFKPLMTSRLPVQMFRVKFPDFFPSEPLMTSRLPVQIKSARTRVPLVHSSEKNGNQLSRAVCCWCFCKCVNVIYFTRIFNVKKLSTTIASKQSFYFLLLIPSHCCGCFSILNVIPNLKWK